MSKKKIKIPVSEIIKAAIPTIKVIANAILFFWYKSQLKQLESIVNNIQESGIYSDEDYVSFTLFRLEFTKSELEELNAEYGFDKPTSKP